MSTKLVTVPELFLIAGTRVALGAGIGLLLADRLNDDQRRAVGWTLLAVGAVTTIPLAAEVIFRQQDEARAASADVSSVQRQIPATARVTP